MFGKKPVEEVKPKVESIVTTPGPDAEARVPSPPTLDVKSRVQFTGPLGVVNTGTVLKIEGDLLAVAMDVPVFTLTKGEAKIIG
jgi:hypothetical protein